MFDQATLRRDRPRSHGNLGTSVRIVGLLLLGCVTASATAMLYPGREGAEAHAAQPTPRPEAAQGPAAPAPAKPLVRASAEASRPAPAPAEAPAVRQIPLSGGVDPTPAAVGRPTRPQPAPQDRAAPAAPPQPAPAVLASTPKTPTECLPGPLLTLLQDVQARFGAVTLVSTRHLHTDNHTPGSARHKMHAGCKAVDFQVAGDLNAVAAYLRSRPEVGGVNVYRNNRVIHVDYAERKLARAER